ncbi:aldose epimerase family protein [Egicoccus sp. AB-alg6-2]|uniref:aldose epimerase family protein n=1 Tax=Egicoccus sp. AB-alg6-2 TaxID=3242692 RepID=UPI00359E683D
MTATDFGTTPDGRSTRRFRLVGAGLEVDVTDFGATIVAVRAPDRDGRSADIALGHDRVDGYADPANPHLGVTVGRVANRIGGATFVLDGTTYRLAANHGPHHLHGGEERAFDRVVWEVADVGDDRLELTHTSPDGDEGYPGQLEVRAVFEVVGNRLEVTYHATSDARTPVNMTNHAYFNLAGDPVTEIGDHRVQVLAERYTPTDDELIPTGEIAEVAGTPLDLREPTRLGDRLPQLTQPPAGGFDHNFVLGDGTGEVRLAARVTEPTTGRTLEVHTDQAAVQFYSGNMLDGSVVGRAGVPYPVHTAFCLEPQGYPDAVNQPDFPSIILEPGQAYRHRTHYVFGAA